MGLIKICFAGSYKCDLMLYLSRMLIEAGKKIAIIDASQEQFFRYAVPIVFGSDTIVTYRDIDVYFNIQNADDLKECLREAYDTILIDVGFNQQMADYLVQCDYGILTTDPRRYNVQKLKLLIQEIQKHIKGKPEEDRKIKLVRIFRDFCSGKINYKYVAGTLDTPEAMDYIGQYLFFMDENDQRIHLSCEYDDIFKFNKLSKEYKLMFADMLETFFQMEKKQIQKSMRRAERGR